MKKIILFLLVTLATKLCWATPPLPIIDMHLHALPADAQGPPPLGMCTPIHPFPTWDPATPYGDIFMRMFKQPPCDDPVWSPETDGALMEQTIDAMERHNIVGVLSGSVARVQEWMQQAPGRFYPGLGFQIGRDALFTEDIRKLALQGQLAVLAEVTNQYGGVLPDDPRMAPYWALAEELDLPVGIHIGTGPPGVIYLGNSHYRARMHSALDLEEVLVRHPRLRVYIMHAGFPMLDDLLAVLYAHPQVYVDTGVIVYTQTAAAFYNYLRGIFEAGFGKRVMFGSDQMVWPGVIERSIMRIKAAPFLSEEQKRDILYNNAARFLRLDEKERTRHRQLK